MNFQACIGVKNMLEFKEVIGKKQNVKLHVEMVVFWLYQDK